MHVVAAETILSFLAFYFVRNGYVLVKGYWEFEVLSLWPLKKSNPLAKWQRPLCVYYEAAYILSIPLGV